MSSNSKVRAQIRELRLETHELRVQIHELRVRIHELRVQIHELRVRIHELQVQIHESLNQWKFKETALKIPFPMAICEEIQFLSQALFWCSVCIILKMASPDTLFLCSAGQEAWLCS